MRIAPKIELSDGADGGALAGTFFAWGLGSD